MTKYTIAYTPDKEEGGYTGQCVELPAAISEGETIEELKKNMIEAINLVLDSYHEEIKSKHKMVIEVQT
jgi:predicted RNase H-like HicB family nuclease